MDQRYGRLKAEFPMADRSTASTWFVIYGWFKDAVCSSEYV